MDLVQYSSSDSENEEEVDKKSSNRAESSVKHFGKQSSNGNSSGSGMDKKSGDGTNYDTVNMELSEDSDEQPTKKYKRSTPDRKRERETSPKKSSRRDRGDDDRRRSHDSKYSKGSRDDRRSSRNNHYPRESYSRRYDNRTDKYRRDNRSYHRDERRREEESSYRDRSHRVFDRSDSDRNSRKSSEIDKHRRSNRDERRRKTPSKSPSTPQKDKRNRSRSRSKDHRLEKEKSKSPEIIALTALPVNQIVNPIVAERKLAKLDQLGITLNAPVAPKTDNAVEIPSYYNPNAINVAKYAEQIQKRKLLWSGKKAEPATSSTWNAATFSQDTDGKVASKFMRLMGIKDSQPKSQSEGTTVTTDVDKQKQLFSTMEQQYEVARQVTHCARGVGLGFGSQPRQF